jgi:hypothetical protein
VAVQFSSFKTPIFSEGQQTGESATTGPTNRRMFNRSHGRQASGQSFGRCRRSGRQQLRVCSAAARAAGFKIAVDQQADRCWCALVNFLTAWSQGYAYRSRRGQPIRQQSQQTKDSASAPRRKSLPSLVSDCGFTVRVSITRALSDQAARIQCASPLVWVRRNNSECVQPGCNDSCVP